MILGGMNFFELFKLCKNKIKHNKEGMKNNKNTPRPQRLESDNFRSNYNRFRGDENNANGGND